MHGELFIVLRWWGTLFLIGAVAFPLTKKLFSGWFDRGYLFSKAVGMATVTWIVYVLARIHLVPFTEWSIYAAAGIVFFIGLLANFQFSIFNFQSNSKDKFSKSERYLRSIGIIALEELFFFAALLFWSWIKAHEPSIHGLEKFMDYGFTQSILNSQFFPAPDMWYAGLPINYYYFGHTVMAVLTRLSGLDLGYTFNLMLATTFAFTLTMSFSIGAQISRIGQKGLIRPILAGLLTAFLLTSAGNMQTIYAFTKGYSGDAVKPFWELLWSPAEFPQKVGEGMERYWYANATRFIPFTIHEFPSYSFVVSDMHGHVLSLPFALLAIALLIAYWGDRGSKERWGGWGTLGFYGFLCGILLMTNALDGPIYAGLFVILALIHDSGFSIHEGKWWVEKGKMIGIVALAALAASLPFLSHFKSFVSGVALNCPPGFLANTKIGPLLFEGVEKCQHSPLWMMWLLWGFFIFCGFWLIVSKLKVKSEKLKFKEKRLGFIGLLFSGFTQVQLVLIIFFLYAVLLIIFPEFFYFKDIYPQHFRSNTMFKLGYEAFLLFSIVSGYTIVSTVFGGRSEKRSKFSIFNFQFSKAAFIILVVPQLFLVSIFPIFAVRSYFNSLRTYESIGGLGWLQQQHPDDYAAIHWLKSTIYDSPRFEGEAGQQSTILEADGDSYTDYARMSAFTGMPTIIGWPVHEWLWRGTYDVVAPRREEVRQLYESSDMAATKELLGKYQVRYIIIGSMERQKFTNLQEWKFAQLGDIVFRQGSMTIYQIKSL